MPDDVKKNDFAFFEILFFRTQYLDNFTVKET